MVAEDALDVSEFAVTARVAGYREGMTAGEVAHVYLGKNPSQAPFDLPESTPARADFHRQVTGKGDAQSETLWPLVVVGI